MPHSIHPHGLDVNQANDGVPSTSGFVGMSMGGGMMGMPANFGRVAGTSSLGSSFTYSFVAPHAGTYAYHCHVDTVLHLEMGMAGVIVVRPADGSDNRVWDNGPVFDKEYIWQLHTMDSSWHNQMISGAGTIYYRPNLFLINGRDSNQIVNDTATAISAGAGSRVLVRLVNLGYLPASVSMGGLSFSMLASDGRPLARQASASQLLIGPGERYDILLTMPSQGSYQARVNYSNIRGDGNLGGVSAPVSVV